MGCLDNFLQVPPRYFLQVSGIFYHVFYAVLVDLEYLVGAPYWEEHQLSRQVKTIRSQLAAG